MIISNKDWKKWTGPGVYIVKDGDGNVLYVGAAHNVFNRVFNKYTHPKVERARLVEGSNMLVFFCASRREAFLLEQQLVIALKPSLNSPPGLSRHGETNSPSEPPEYWEPPNHIISEILSNDRNNPNDAMMIPMAWYPDRELS